MKSKIETGKTTVTFPTYILQGLRAYMIREQISAHKQSEIVADAVREFLRNHNVELPPDDGKQYEYIVTLKEI
jgi:hypothetical protein